MEDRKSANSLLSSVSPNYHSAVSNHDPWNGLATLMTLLETIVDTNKDYLSLQRKKGGYIARGLYSDREKAQITAPVKLIKNADLR